MKIKPDSSLHREIQSLPKMSFEELRALQNAISLEIRLRQKLKATQFAVGQRVKFPTRTYGMLRGKIEKINTCSVVVRAFSGTCWTVSPLLVAVEAR